jgi:thioesterase domain-containing protein/aryl carrier-like protein
VYWVGSDSCSEHELRQHLQRWLPAFMMPSALVRLEALPRTPNQKIDRRALPVPDGRVSGIPQATKRARTPLELELQLLWEDLLGKRIGVDEDFFAVGGDSLLALRLISRVRARAGLEIITEQFLAQPTIQGMVAALKSGDREDGPLVRFRAGGALSPLVCVHPLGGNVMCYAELARQLNPQRPFYGLQMPCLQGPGLRIEEMAAEYLRALREAGVSGPMHLGGWSFGGLVAFEMARQMRAEGRKVSSLILIDSAATLPMTEEEVDTHFVHELLISDFLNGRELWAGKTDEVEQGAEGGERLPCPEELKDLLPIYRANLLAAARYVAQPVEVDACLLQATVSPMAELERMARDWHRLTCGRLRRKQFAVDHFGLLSRAHAAVLARAIEEVLDVRLDAEEEPVHAG